MPVLDVPALRSDDPLGFLAALGLVETCSTALGLEARLGWRGLGDVALLSSDFSTVDELASELHALASRLAAEGRVVPPPEPSLVRKRLSDAERKAKIEAKGFKPPNDPMRMEIEDAISSYAALQGAELQGEPTGARWLVGLLGQLSPIDKSGAAPYCDVTPLYAPAGQQTMHQLYEKYVRLVARSPQLMHEALVGWRRSPSDSGANLDWRDIRDATATSSGTSENAGVPGATWLALQSAPFFRLVGDGVHGDATGWVKTSPRGRPRKLRWPVWSPLLDPTAISVLLEHSEVRKDAPEPGRLRALRVVAILESSRRSSGNSDGPLRPARVAWAS